MSFDHPNWLWALLALIPLALVEWLAMRRAHAASRLLVGEQSGRALLAHRIPGSHRLGVLLRMAAVVAFVFGAAGPQWGREAVRRQAQGSDVVFVIDVSLSMDARDVAPSRLEEARREAYALLDRLPGSRVGIVAFAGDAVRVCPLTLDQATVRLVLGTLGSGSVTTPGTDLGRALRTALKMLPAGRRQEQAVVLWTDGEDLEAHAESQVADLQRAGVRVFAVGVGTPAGEVIPVVDEMGRTVDVKKDEEGNVVRSRLDEKLLRHLGRVTRGAAFFATRSGGELPRLVAALGTLGRSSHGMRLVERPVSRFPWLALLGLALLAWDLARVRSRAEAAPVTAPDTPARSREAVAAKPAAGAAAARTAVASALLAALLAAFGARPAAAQTTWAKGDVAFRKGRWAQAESLYALRAARGGPAPVRVNLATSRARAGRFEEGTRDLARLAADPGAAGQTASYNLGTLLGEKGDIEPALGELRRAMERNPNDKDARWNYELLRQRQRQGAGKPDPDRPPDQQPNPSPGQSGQQPQPQPSPNPNTPPQPQDQNPQSSPNAPSPQQNSPSPGEAGAGAPGMSKQQAEQLLSSLGELERLEQAQLKRMRVLRDRKRKDW